MLFVFLAFSIFYRIWIDCYYRMIVVSVVSRVWSSLFAALSTHRHASSQTSQCMRRFFNPREQQARWALLYSIIITQQDIDIFLDIFIVPPYYYLRSLFPPASFSQYSDPGSPGRLFSLLSPVINMHNGSSLACYRQKTSTFSSIVDFKRFSLIIATLPQALSTFI